MAASEATDLCWPGGGKAQFIALCKSANDSDRDCLKKNLYNVCQRLISDELRLDQVIPALREVTTANPIAGNVLADVLHLCDMETSADGENKRRRDALVHLLSATCETVLSEPMLRERLELDTAGDAGIVVNKKAAGTKFVKLKTRLYYKQQKFNLLREESEGYAKLIAELSQEENDFDVTYMLQVIRSLIGCFNLDPNRVMDILLEVFEMRIGMEELFVDLIRQFLDNSTALTQVLAFKFNFYQERVTPESLYLLAAILSHHKLINITELYCYLSPKDKLIEDHHKHELEEAKKEARAAVIISTAEEKVQEERFTDGEKFSLKVNNQKLGLIAALLQVGSWQDALTLMSLMPEHYCLTSSESICRNIARLISVAIDPLYRNNSGMSRIIAAKLRPFHAPQVRYFTSVTTRSQFLESVVPMISFLGPFMYVDVLLIVKLVRMFKTFFKQAKVEASRKKAAGTGTSPAEGVEAGELGPSGVHNEDEIIEVDPDEGSASQLENELTPELHSAMLTILDDGILPAVSLVESNCGLSEELWQLLKHLRYETRYRLYHGWKKDPSNSLLMKKRAGTLKKIKWIMKRLSKENIKLSGRQIGKLSHSNPSFLFDNMLLQIQAFDNLIGPVVDSLKYLTTLSFDVLVYCIIEVLADSGKGRTKHDGATISPWILSLSNFCGSVAKKYPVELPGLFQFIANQLKAEKSLDLLILKEVVTKMAGIEATEQMTDEQLAALSGGELLRQEGGYFNQVRNTRKSSMRLKDALLENNLAIPLCILMAQQRNCILFREQEHSHLKLVGKLYDQCQETLVQFGSFLSTCLSIDDYSGRLPSPAHLLVDFNLNPDVAFFLLRPMISHKITVKFDEFKKSRAGSDMTKMFVDAWEEETGPLVDAVIPALKGKFWDDLSPRFFVTFWILSMYDLEVPKSSYNRETDKLKQQSQDLEDNSLQQNKKKKEIERTRLLMEKLLEEQLKQDQHVSRIRMRLDVEKDQWFQSKVAKMEMTTQFLQYCLFPRCIFTASDAIFCAKFVYLLHMLKTPNFSTLICYDRIFGDISYTMCSCTENEASHYGRFLCSVLETVMRWHRDRSLFEKECAKYPGFITKFSEADPVHVDYENYRHVCHKWHYRLTKALILCLDSEDYIQIRNSLVVLTKIISFFPLVTNFAQAIEKRVDIIREKEKSNRKDLYALATGYVGQLKTKRSSFVPEQEFHYKEVRKPAPPSSETSSTTSKSSPAATPKKEISPSVEIKKEKNGERRDKAGTSQDPAPVRVASSNHTNDKRGVASMPAPRIKVEKADREVNSTNSNPATVRVKQERNGGSGGSSPSNNTNHSSSRSKEPKAEPGYRGSPRDDSRTSKSAPNSAERREANPTPKPRGSVESNSGKDRPAPVRASTSSSSSRLADTVPRDKLSEPRQRTSEPQVRIKQEDSKLSASSPRKATGVSDGEYDRSRDEAKRRKSTTSNEDYERDVKRRKAAAAAALPEYEKDVKRRNRGSDRDSDPAAGGKRAYDCLQR